MYRIHALRDVAEEVDALVAEAEARCENDPALFDVAAMVYVGDVYALREDIPTLADTHWGRRRYTSSLDQDPL
ncbi:MAG: hypothetical protein ACE5K1_03050 [Acidiferrobacterales bacterium]